MRVSGLLKGRREGTGGEGRGGKAPGQREEVWITEKEKTQEAR